MVVMPVNADTIIPIDQQRMISGLVIVPQCGDKGLANDAAEGFEPFNSSVKSELICDLAGSVASARQLSQIDPNSMTASARVTSAANTEVQDTIQSISHSLFEVTFELNTVRTFTLSGMIRADAFGEPTIFAGVILRLSGPEDATIFESAVDSLPDSENEKLELEEMGLLEPGQYTLRAEAASVISNEVPPSQLAQAQFEFTLDILNLGDLDGDLSVATADLIILFSNWGPCFICLACPADLDGDCQVSISDLLILFSNWT